MPKRRIGYGARNRKFRKYRRIRGGPRKPRFSDMQRALYYGVGAWRLAKRLKSLVNVEHKKYDTFANGPIGNTGALIMNFTSIGQSSDEGGREGNSILCKKLYIKGYLRLNGSATSTMVRLLLVRDTQQVGDSSPVIGEILDPDAPDYFSAPLNNRTVGRFDILQDRTYSLSANLRTEVPIEFFHTMMKHMRFNGANAVDIQKNGLYLLGISDEATNTPTFVATGRLTYIDN